jgi:hypothetical protein
MFLYAVHKTFAKVKVLFELKSYFARNLYEIILDIFFFFLLFSLKIISLSMILKFA